MVKAIIFDLDGTLLYTLVDLMNAANHSLSAYNHKTISLDETKAYIGNGIKKLIKRALNDKLDDFDNIYKLFTEYYNNHLLENTIPYDNITILLKELKKRNIKTAVVSNKYQLGVDILIDKHFKDLIDFKIGASDDIPLKPDPKMVNIALNKLNITTKEALYVGDSDTDMLTAKNSNIKAIGVSYGYRDSKLLKASGAYTIIDDPLELIDIITKENEYE